MFILTSNHKPLAQPRYIFLDSSQTPNQIT